MNLRIVILTAFLLVAVGFAIVHALPLLPAVALTIGATAFAWGVVASEVLSDDWPISRWPSRAYLLLGAASFMYGCSIASTLALGLSTFGTLSVLIIGLLGQAGVVYVVLKKESV